MGECVNAELPIHIETDTLEDRLTVWSRGQENNRLAGELVMLGLATLKIVPAEDIPILREQPPAGDRGVARGGDDESARADRVSNVCQPGCKSGDGSGQKNEGTLEGFPRSSQWWS